MDFFNFGGTHADGTQLSGYRALLGLPWLPRAWFIVVRLISFACFVVIIMIMIVDADLYGHTHPTHDHTEAAGAWLSSGANMAALLAALYFAARSLFACGETNQSDNAAHAAGDLPCFGRLVWFLHTLALPAVWTTFLLYELILKHRLGNRASQEALYATTFTLLTLSFVLGNTPLLLKHSVVWSIALLIYLFMVMTVEHMTGRADAPVFAVGPPAFIYVCGLAVYVVLVGVGAARAPIYARCRGEEVPIWRGGK